MEYRKPRKVKEKIRKVFSSVVNPGTKRRSASPQRRSGRVTKAHKLHPDSTPPRADEAAKDVATLHRTPATKRMASHSSLIDREHIVYAADMETQIAAEARGVTRRDVPWHTFSSIYLRGFSAEPGAEVSTEA